ncbi:MAG: hypothetical protein GY853_15650, partial [PVC group bacterium]|nr:hypothetical protein [PVC group bacterium]
TQIINLIEEVSNQEISFFMAFCRLLKKSDEKYHDKMLEIVKAFEDRGTIKTEEISTLIKIWRVTQND